MKQWTKPKVLPLPLKGLIPLWDGAIHPIKLLRIVVIELDSQEFLAEMQSHLLIVQKAMLGDGSFMERLRLFREHRKEQKK